jgi:UTP--glucose-1-phosphate uridylyltransferase
VKAVITLAGEGTRLLPATRGLRKEMLPLFYRGVQGTPVLAPVVHHVVRTLVGAGVREMALVVGPDQGWVRRYFEPDEAFLERHRSHPERLRETLALGRMLRGVRFHWIVQPRPRGFGDALLRARGVVGGDPFLLHAADAVLREPREGELPRRMEQLREREGASAVLLVRRVKDPRRYGVVEGRLVRTDDGLPYLDVSGMEEKPAHPRSPWAATAIYALSPEIFPLLRREARPDRELEVTQGLSALLQEGHRVLAVRLPTPGHAWLSVGSPEGYYRALQRTYRAASRGTDRR